jgi:peptide subunit release factor RF-3
VREFTNERLQRAHFTPVSFAGAITKYFGVQCVRSNGQVKAATKWELFIQVRTNFATD